VTRVSAEARLKAANVFALAFIVVGVVVIAALVAATPSRSPESEERALSPAERAHVVSCGEYLELSHDDQIAVFRELSEYRPEGVRLHYETAWRYCNEGEIWDSGQVACSAGGQEPRVVDAVRCADASLRRARHESLGE
jgi:hypothetical protein